MVRVRYRFVAAAALVVGVAVTGLIASGLIGSSAMHWCVRDDDAFSFVVEVQGFTRTINTSGWIDTEAPYSFLNGSSFTVRISHLPALESSYTSSSFATGVLEYVKSELDSPVMLVNGTEIPDPEYGLLNALVSRSVLPVGGWAAIDSFYPDTPEFIYSCDTYMASTDSTRFSIGYRAFNIDAGHGWNATVNMETGVPIQATVWACRYHGMEWFSYSILITLA